MRKTFTVLAMAVVVALSTIGMALAATLNPGTSVENGVITLDNSEGGTSYEDHSDVVLVPGDTVSFEYRVLGDGSDVCGGGTPRVFIQAGAYNTHDAAKNDGSLCGDIEELDDGWFRVTGTPSTPLSGEVGDFGVVNDNPSNVRVIEVRNIRFGSTSLFASNQEECKKGGWEAGNWRNQGQCVSQFARSK